MIRLYEVGTEAAPLFSPPQSLTADEAVDLHQRRILCACDYSLLSFEAALAVALEIEATVRGSKSRGAVIFWGVKSPTIVHQGRA